MSMLFPPGEFERIKSRLTIYKCALRNIQARIDTLVDDFDNFQMHNPIEHVKSRIKKPESIANKLYRQGIEITAENACETLTDIAGLRCICYFAKDIFYLAEVIKRQPDIVVRSEKDYVTYPKPSGYRSYHMILDVPVYLTDKTEILPVEIQIRTQAMDFWASLEHKVKYKYHNKMPKHLSDDLVKCAEQITELDNRMYLIHEIVDMAYTPLGGQMVDLAFSTR